MRFVAHRGLHTVHPENSLAAFCAAWEAGIEWCECDVQFCAGGEAVVIHDETLDRVTGRAGRIWELTPRELAEYRLLGTDEAPPLLSELLRVMPPKGKLLIEVKPANVSQSFVDTIRGVSGKRVMIQSFHQSALYQVANMSYPLALLIEDAGKIAGSLSGSWAAVHVDYRLLNESVAGELRRSGKSIGVWTVNDPVEIQRAISLGAETIISDPPPNIGRSA